jgi:transposase-like protein/IS1 family transposase
VNCEHCGHEHVAKFGKDRHGLQRYRCKSCGKTFTERHALSGRQTSMTDAVRVLSMLLEGMSVRSCERLTGMHRDTILSLMLEAGTNCRRFMENAVKGIKADYIECDEQWAFVFCKRKTAERLELDSSVGDRYVFTALDRDTKLLICWHAGQRDPSDTWTFVDKLATTVTGRPTISTDGFHCYTPAIPTIFRQNVDYAQIVKQFQGNGGMATQRYSPGQIRRIDKTVVCGAVAEADIGTSRMERFNLSTRMHVRRFTRLTNAHSKKMENHDAMLGLYFAWYNWCRMHSSIKSTPAVRAGLASQRWTLEQLLTNAAVAA